MSATNERIVEYLDTAIESLECAVDLDRDNLMHNLMLETMCLLIKARRVRYASEATAKPKAAPSKLASEGTDVPPTLVRVRINSQFSFAHDQSGMARHCKDGGWSVKLPNRESNVWFAEDEVEVLQ